MKSNKLNLKDMWRLYLLLKPALENRKREDSFLDEVDVILSLSPDGTLVEGIDILYDNIDKDELSGIQTLSLFILGLKRNKFFEFVDFIGQFDG
jgi:hypothetical protein